MDFSSVYKKIFAIFLGLIISFLFVEAGARFINLESKNSKTKFLSSDDRFFFYLPTNKRDSYLFWRLKPLVKFGTISINSKGFRGKEFSRKKDNNTIRIMNMGDSCTLGVGVSEEETYTVQLEDILNKNFKYSRRYEFINAGVAGYSSLQGLRYLESELIKYEPDIITIQYGFNDYIYTIGPSDKEIPQKHPLSIYIEEFVNKSHFYRFLNRRLSSLAAPIPYPPNRRVNISDFKKNLREIITIAKESGAKVLVLNLPLRPEIPLVVNPIPMPRDGVNGQFVEWLRPAIIGQGSYYANTNFEGPTSELEEAVRKYPQWAMAHYLLAKRYESTGQKEKAEEEFAKAKEMDIDRRIVGEYNKIIEEVTMEMKTPLIDIAIAFEAQKGKNLFLDERHPNSIGHRTIAEVLYHALKENNLIGLD